MRLFTLPPTDASLPSRRSLLASAALLVVATLLACDEQPSPPPGPSAAISPRIVALSPAIARTLRDLGLGDKVVGRHGFDAWTDQGIPSVGDQAGIDYEALLGVRPTHVLLEWGSRTLPTRLTELAGHNGWVVRSYSVLGVDDLRALLEDLPRTLGVPEARPRAEALVGSMKAALTPTAAGGQPLRVLALASATPPAAFGPGSFHAQLLERLGVLPVPDLGGPFIDLDAEDVLRLAPDAVLLFLPRPAGAAPAGPPLPGQIREALGPIAMLDLPAWRANRVAIVDHPLGLVPSTAMIEIAADIRRTLIQWAERDSAGH